MTIDPDHAAAPCIDQTGERRADVRIVDGGSPRSATTRPDRRRRRRDRRGRLRRLPRLRRPAHPPARAGQGGGRDDRDRVAGGGARRLHRVVAMPNTDPTQDSRQRRRVRPPPGRGAGLCDVRPSGSITIGRPGEQLVTVRRAGRGRRPPLHRRRQRRAGPAADAPGARVRDAISASCWRSTARSKRLTGGRRDARGRLLQSTLGLPGWPSIAEELMVHPRHRAGPPHRRAGPLPAPVDGAKRRARPGGEGRRAARHRRGHAAPHQPHRRTARGRTARSTR